MKIGELDTNQKVCIIAEIGNNHEGSLSLAREMIGQAAAAGVDAVKFQTIVPRHLVAPDQSERITQLQKLCLPVNAFAELKQTADDAGVVFLSTPFDIQSVAMLAPLVPAFKIASGDNTFFPLLAVIAKTKKPVLLSTGMSDFYEVTRIRDYLLEAWRLDGHNGQLALLHCVSAYPTQPHQANLLAMRSLADLGVTIGYSDHTLGINAAVLSVAMGARIVEKHFTLDKHYSEFQDHQLSADPKEMTELVGRIREAETMLGSPHKQLLSCEAGVADQARRSAVAATDLPQGSRLTEKRVLWLRPGGGIPPSEAKSLINRRLKRTIRYGERIDKNALA